MNSAQQPQGIDVHAEANCPLRQFEAALAAVSPLEPHPCQCRGSVRVVGVPREQLLEALLRVCNSPGCQEALRGLPAWLGVVGTGGRSAFQ